MTAFLVRFTGALLLSAAATFACRADSLASSASSAGSASLGSISDSIGGSSKSSSGDKKVADGDYRVIELAALPERPGMLRLHLKPRAAAADDETGAFTLDLPQKALGSQGMAAADVVSVRNRPYGLEFARAQSSEFAQAQTREAFFLVLSDEWRSDLEPRPVARPLASTATL